MEHKVGCTVGRFANAPAKKQKTCFRYSCTGLAAQSMDGSSWNSKHCLLANRTLQLLFPVHCQPICTLITKCTEFDHAKLFDSCHARL